MVNMNKCCRIFLGHVFFLLSVCIALLGCDQKTSVVDPNSSEFGDSFNPDYGKITPADSSRNGNPFNSDNGKITPADSSKNGNPFNQNRESSSNYSSESIYAVTPLDVMYGDALDSRKLSDYEKEFLLNYAILYTFYPFAHSDSLVPKGTYWYSKRLGQMSDYLNQGEKYVRPKIKLEKTSLDILYMYYSLNDDYTYYMPAEAMSFDDFMYEFDARDEVSDLGVNVHMIGSSFVVMQTYAGSSARLYGIQVGDTIVSINNAFVPNMKVFEDLTSGKVGSAINLKIARNVDGVRTEVDISLAILSYVPPTVTYKIIDSVPVIHISEFAENNTPSDTGTYGEFIDALKATSEYKSTIIDLRGNLGGDVSMCDAVSAEMLPQNDTMYYTYEGSIDSITGVPLIVNVASVTKRDGSAKDRYFVFLADSNSASCSEATLVSVACNKGFPIVGTTTHGKGIAYALVQTYLGGTSIFTQSILVDKKGEIYHAHGIDPDVFQDDPDKALDTALSIAKAGVMTRVAGYSQSVSPNYLYPQSYLAKKSALGEVSRTPRKRDLGMIRKLDLRK